MSSSRSPRRKSTSRKRSYSRSPKRRSNSRSRKDSRDYGERQKNTQIYIKGFSRKTERQDLKDAFRKYGKIEEVQLKDGYGFVRFYDHKDADDAVKSMHRKYLTKYDDNRLTVEPSGGGRKNRDYKPYERREFQPRERDGNNPRGPQPKDECFYCKKPGHWKNECKSFFASLEKYKYQGGGRDRYDKNDRNERSSRRRYSSSSSSSSRDSRRRSSRRKRSHSSSSSSRRSDRKRSSSGSASKSRSRSRSN